MKRELERLNQAQAGVTATAPYEVGDAHRIAPQMVTTAFALDGYRIARNLGVVRGITVRSRSIFGTIGAGFQTIVGGNISIFTRLCEQTRAEAFQIMLTHAGEIGANAVVGARYDATEIMNGVTEVLAYGTAVIVVPDEGTATPIATGV